MTTGDLCKKLRKDVGLTQKELAEAMGVSQATINRAETGKLIGRMKNPISETTANKYKEYFGVDVMKTDIPEIKIEFDASDFENQTEKLKKAEKEINKELVGKQMNDMKKEILNKVGYSYTVDQATGRVEVNVATTKEELKDQLLRSSAYCDTLEEEIKNLKAELESEKEHSKFYESRFRELDAENDALRTKCNELQDEVNELADDACIAECKYEELKDEFDKRVAEESKTYKTLYEQDEARIRELSNEVDTWSVRYDGIYSDLIDTAVELHEKDKILYDILLTQHKNRTKEPV